MHDDIVRLNYVTHFREWWAEKRARLNGTPSASVLQQRVPLELAYELLGRAQCFLLPVGGWLLDNDGRLEAKYAPLCHLPFPVTAFEFRSLGEPRESFGVGRSASKRIALCIDASVLNEMRIYSAGEDEWGCMTLCYIDDLGMWGALPVLSIVSRSGTMAVTESLIDYGKRQLTEARHFGAYDGVKPKCPKIGTECMDIRVALFPGFEAYPMSAALADTRDELIAAVQACAALACSNMQQRTIPASALLNEKRKRSGKEPFVSYHVLDIADEHSERSESKGGSHNSPRQHLRRGHIRRLGDVRVTWVNSCVVGAESDGKVIKDYRVTA